MKRVQKLNLSDINLELQRKSKQIDDAREHIKSIEQDVVDWFRQNKNSIKPLMPKNGKIYKLKTLDNIYWWKLDKYSLSNETYYFKPHKNRFDPKNWFRYSTKYIPIKGDILDCNFNVVLNDEELPIDDLEEISNNEEAFNGRRKLTKIYVMIDKNTGYYKIGRSVNPERRERTLQSEKPTIEMIFNHDARIYDEKELHDMFSEKRIRGEWFDLNGSDLSSIRQYFKTIR